MIDSPLNERDRMRRLILAMRDRLSPAERDSGSSRIAASLKTLPFFSENQTFFIYCHFRSEVQTAHLIAHCLANKKHVCVPLCLPAEARMHALAIVDPAHELAPGYMGIPEPLPTLAPERIVPPEAIEVAVIPGSVFDRRGHRLGYGLGYYDRFLAQAPRAIRIGLAFSCQVVDWLPAQPHDEPMDVIVTEREVLILPERGHATNRGV